jgi:nucleotide-binding universal stress UspA family protein
MSGKAAATVPRIASVLAPTDLSELGNAAVRWACALLAAGGRLHLLHVVHETDPPNPLYAHYSPGRRPPAAERAAQERDLAAALRGLLPADAAARGIDARIEIAHARDPAEAICAAAERLGVDAICLATHGRSGLSELVTGSVAREVAACARRPLYLVRLPDRT